MSRRGANRDRLLGDRLWDADGVEWTRVRTGGYHLDPDDVRDLLARQGLPVGLLLYHSPVRWLDTSDAALALRELLSGQGPFCENPLGGSVWHEVSGSRRLVVLEEVH